MKVTPTKITTGAAMRVAAIKLKFVAPRKLEERLKYAADGLADAYVLGALEAQGEIIRRLNLLGATKPRFAQPDSTLQRDSKL
jgi:hypothetical protein